MSAPRRWQLPALTLVLVVVGTAALTLGLALGVAGGPSSAPTPPATATPAPSGTPTVRTTEPQAATGDVADLVDADWATATADATGVPERAVRVFAGASIAATQAHPACGLGWNTLAALARTPGRGDGPLHLPARTWEQHAADGGGDGAREVGDLHDAALAAAMALCADGTDLSVPEQWRAAVAALRGDGLARVTRVAARLSAS